MSLEAELPLALLPIRIEARYYLDEDPPELRLRFFPDAIHADGHADRLTQAEQDLGRAFWRRTWRAGGDTAGEDAAFAWLAEQIGPWRAAWVAGQLRPTNPADAPKAPVPDALPLKPPPKFPAVETLDARGPTRARLLPERFAVFGYHKGKHAGTWWGEHIPEGLPMAPGLAEAEDGIDGRGLLAAQGLAWTFDFEEAEKVGMALRIDLSKVVYPVETDGFSELQVLGVCVGDQREALEELLEGHRYTHGLDFIPQGTPTNSTETAAAGPSLEAPDLAAVRATELDAGAAPERPAVEAEGDLYRMTAANAASVALGIGRDNALDRAGEADLPELARAEAMNQALWPAVGGHYLDSLVQGAVTGEDRDWLRDWSARFVRGAGPLPSLLVGREPYGVLPVTLVEPEIVPAGNVQHVEDVLGELLGSWQASLPNVPHLDPDATDAPPDEDQAAAAATRFPTSSTPCRDRSRTRPTSRRSPRRSSARSRTPRRSGLPTSTTCARPTRTSSGDWSSRPAIESQDWPDPNGNPWGIDHPFNIALTWAWEFEQELAAATTFGGQIRAVEDHIERLSDAAADTETYKKPQRDYFAMLAEFLEPALELLRGHETRTEPLEWLAERVPDITRMIDDENDPKAFFALRPTDAAFELPLVAEDRSEAALADLRVSLLRIWEGVRKGGLVSSEPGVPLLTQLLHWSAEQALGTDDNASLSSGLDVIINELLDGSDDPVGELERLMRETLGPWSYRLDAWYTAVAAWRLENKRSTKPRGIQVGGYGWLLDVKPRETQAASQGYVLAPSLSHATSAAILRSGWSAFGEGLEVDLSSDRMRRALWIIDGVRRGQDLGQLVGARFERGLQDAGLAKWIDDFREIALEAVGSSVPPNAIVDGLLLARGHEDPADVTDDEEAAGDGIDTLLKGDAAADADELEGVLGSLIDDLDAVADAAVAQSVFSLTQGNLPEATATLSAAATGEASFPDLRLADTPREALTITHRLLLALDPDAPPSGWPAARGRAHAAPALESWLGGLLGDPKDYGFSVRFDDADSGKPLAGPFAVTLAEVGLSALDLVFLAPAGEDTGLGRLGDVLAAWGEGLRPESVPATAVLTLVTGEGDPSIDDLALACRALRRLIAEARDLDGRDVASPGALEVPSGLDVGELAATDQGPPCRAGRGARGTRGGPARQAG